ncbi:MAG: CHAT domain-containing protein, partial [Magnetococcales bacterium]|nr:CHAT domain-containing protein [Magnetococcales bacterium]
TGREETTTYHRTLRAQVLARVLGEDHPTTWDAWIHLARSAWQKGLFSDAISLYEKVLGHAVTALGTTHPRLLRYTRQLAQLRSDADQTEKAEALLNTTCPKVIQLYGVNHPQVAACLTERGRIRVGRAKLKEAAQDFARAESILNSVAERNSDILVQLRLERSVLSLRSGQPAEAEQGLRALLADITTTDQELKESTTKRSVRLAIQSRLIEALTAQSRYEEANALARTTLLDQEQLSGKSSINALQVRGLLAEILRLQGHERAADQLLTTVVTGYEKSLGAHHPSTLAAMTNQALARMQRGLFEEAEPLLRTAATRSSDRRGHGHPETIAIHNNLAMLLEQQGLFDRAATLYTSTLSSATKQLGPHDARTLAVVNNLAYLEMMRGRLQQAEEGFTTAWKGLSASLGATHRTTLKALNNRARTARMLGDLERAAPLQKQALAQRRSSLGATHPDTLRSLHDLGLLFLEQKRTKAAISQITEAWQKARTHLGALHPYTLEFHHSLARAQEQSGDLEAAFSTNRAAFLARSTFLDRVLWSSDDNARSGYLRLFRQEQDAYLSLLSRLKRSQAAGRAIIEVGLRRKGLLLSIAAEQRLITQLADDPALQEISQALSSARRDLAAATLADPSPGVNRAEERHRVEMRVQDLQRRLGTASSRFRERMTIPTPETLVTTLKKGAALVEMMAFRTQGLTRFLVGTLVVGDNGPTWNRTLLADSASLTTAVREFRQVIQDPATEDAELAEVSKALYGHVWQPLEPLLVGAERLHLAPDGILNILPFHALQNSAGDYLATAHDLRIIASSRDLLKQPRSLPKTPTALIIADPDFNAALQPLPETRIHGKKTAPASAEPSSAQTTRSLDKNQLQDGLTQTRRSLRGLAFDPLPGARREGRLIHGRISKGEGNGHILHSDSASEQTVRRSVATPAVLHLATHGFFLKEHEQFQARINRHKHRGASLSAPPTGDNPLLRSGLALAGVNLNAPHLGTIDPDNDGILTAWEALGLNLSQTRLVVLSACETGLGVIHEGEGVYGLRRAFQEAGADGVISSLWEVSDLGTLAFMNGLYKRFLTGTPLHQAYRETQQELMQSPRWGHPFIWAAFVLVDKGQ